MAPYSLCIIIQVTVSTHWFKNTCGAILCSFWKCGTATKCSVQPRTSLPKLKENYKKLTKTVKAARTTWSVEEENALCRADYLMSSTWEKRRRKHRRRNVSPSFKCYAMNHFLPFLLFQFEWKLNVHSVSDSLCIYVFVMYYFLKEKFRSRDEKTNFKRNQKPFLKKKEAVAQVSALKVFVGVQHFLNPILIKWTQVVINESKQEPCWIWHVLADPFSCFHWAHFVVFLSDWRVSTMFRNLNFHFM